MSGLIIAIGLALAAAGFIMIVGRIAPVHMALPATAIVLGLAGYGWQGRPDLGSHPVKGAAEAIRFDERLAAKRREIGERVGPASKWLTMSDGLARSGDLDSAANVLARAVELTPNDADLWVGLGNALVAKGNGVLSPAADHAFRRALALQPEGISPNYFYGLALAQSGQFEASKQLWSALIPRLPEDAGLRAELVRNIQLLDALVARRDAAKVAP